jgi:putative nucleotidyltransferase with HDIG domain
MSVATSEVAVQMGSGDDPALPIARARAVVGRILAGDLQFFDGQSGDRLDSTEGLLADWDGRDELCRQVARDGQPRIIAEEPPLVVLAIPLSAAADRTLVALTLGVIDGPGPTATEAAAAWLLRLPADEAAQWAARQPRWTADGLLRAAEAAVELFHAEQARDRLQAEVDSLSLHLSNTYEEITLLYRLAHNLRLSKNDDELCRTALRWLGDAVPAEWLAIQLAPIVEVEPGDFEARTDPLLLTHGPCPLDYEEFTRLVGHLGLDAEPRLLVHNSPVESAAGGPLSDIRQAVLVPLLEGDNVFGWLAAVNHVEGCEFGTVEAGLLSSIGVLLGIHCGNTELYRQQRELLAGVVRALSSAIDAKDPYTCGHSDRVARVALRIAEEMGCTTEQLNTIYLCGLLHDVGKIGIDDQVLRKPGRLTGPEYEHIKTHAEIGYRILADIRQFDVVLPAVLHHHEQWDGMGYPGKLAGEAIPLTARIIAVADAFDAMGSDRPYRPGMSDEKLDAVLREGAGSQWDAQVVAAFFRARDDIRRIAHKAQQPLEFDPAQWV